LQWRAQYAPGVPLLSRSGSKKLPNHGYNRGRAREYKVMELLRTEGWTVGRSAGSHSPVDVFAAKKGRVLLVQVKSGRARVGGEELMELVKWAEAFDADAEVWHFRGKGNLEKRRVSKARG
jgi:Holliday junction resolvase